MVEGVDEDSLTFNRKSPAEINKLHYAPVVRREFQVNGKGHTRSHQKRHWGALSMTCRTDFETHGCHGPTMSVTFDRNRDNA